MGAPLRGAGAGNAGRGGGYRARPQGARLRPRGGFQRLPRPREGEIAAHALEGCFDAVVCAEDVGRPKPHPEGVLSALATLKRAAARACYVGDHPVDMETGRRAGVRVFGIRSGFPGPGLAAAADRLLSSLDELLLLFPKNQV